MGISKTEDFYIFFKLSSIFLLNLWKVVKNNIKIVLKLILEYNEALVNYICLTERDRRWHRPMLGLCLALSLYLYLYIMYIKAIYWDIKLNLGLCFNWDIPKTKFALLLFSFYDLLQLFLHPTKLEKTKNIALLDRLSEVNISEFCQLNVRSMTFYSSTGPSRGQVWLTAQCSLRLWLNHIKMKYCE